jgi:hypothetical protein
MLRVFLLVCLSIALAKENFRAQGAPGTSNDTALEKCIIAGLCTNTTGCCNGHGICKFNGIASSCDCDIPTVCVSGWTRKYNSADNCLTIDATGCCDGSDKFFDGGCHLETDPERSAKGNLLKRMGNSLYSGDGTKDFQAPFDNPSTILTQIDLMVAELNDSSRGTTTTKGNMLGLGLLEFALKDIVDFVYNETDLTPSFYGKTYPKLKWQANTGKVVNGKAIPKQFENAATSVIDLGPLYDHTYRINVSTHISPYINVTVAVDYWNNVHHMSFEFLVVLRYYHAYHTYAARNLEEYFCGQNGIASQITNTCSNEASLGSKQNVLNWIYEQARRSTIRFSQAILEQGTLQILLINGTSNLGLWDSFFNSWFRTDTNPAIGNGPSGNPRASVRHHQEWAGDHTRVSLTQRAISGLDFLISMRNPNTNTAASDVLSNSACLPVPNSVAYDVIALARTPLRKYGSQVASQYKSDLALQFYRVAELGLASYKTHIGQLTNQTTTGVNDIITDYNVFRGSQIEANSTRKFNNIYSSVAVASIVPINDALIVDRSSYWHTDTTGFWTAQNYHPDSQYINLPEAYNYENCYQEDSACTATSTNAAAIVLGYHPDMSILRDDIFEENPAYYRSGGVTFSHPDPNGLLPSTHTFSDYSLKQSNLWRILPEVINPLFYQYDGLNTIAVKQAGSLERYLVNQLVDSIPTNIAWNDGQFDATCYRSDLMSPTCSRAASSIYDGGACTWVLT